MRSSSKLKRRKAIGRIAVDKSHNARSFSLQRDELQPTSQDAPESSQLRDLEPETFHIYETSDGSDVDDAPKARRFLRPPHDEKQEVSTTSADDSPHEDEDEEPTAAILPSQAAASKKNARSKLQAPKNHVQKTSAGHGSQSRSATGAGFTAVNHRLSAKSNSPASGVTVAPPSGDGEGRWPCPSAETYGCTKTFSTRKAATRHAVSHSTKYTCSVCHKVLGRADSLKKHMERHTAWEISMAEAGKEEDTEELGAESAEEANKASPGPETMQADAGAEAEASEFEADAEADIEPETREVNSADEPSSGSEPNGMGADGSPEYATPAETSQAELAVQDDQIGDDDDLEVDPASPPVVERTSASPSLGPPLNDVLITETPIPRQSQKRKRNLQSSGDVESASSALVKRRKKTSASSPTLVPSSADLATDAQAQQVTEKIIPQLQPKRQSSIENWAQPYKPGSTLQHSSLDQVRSPKRSERRIEVLIPRTSQAESSSQLATKSSAPNKARQDYREQKNDREHSNLLSSFTKSKKSDYTTTNGKGRAEAGVTYSSPAKTDRSRGSAQPLSGIATSVAKRTFSKSSAADANEDSASDYAGYTAEDLGDEESSSQPKLKKVANEMFECRTCHVKFTSEKALNHHRRKPNVHKYMVKCQACTEKFPTEAALARHEKETGHGDGNGRQGQVGAFSDSEVQKLNNWKDLFCEEHNITGAQFNDMMTDTLARGRSGTWNWLFIKRVDFMAEYFSVLPRRDKRSMLRYRERNFQNVEGSLNWTEEDDKELVRLQKEMGTKWSKIAKVMMRTQDAVAQRWRHKLQFKETESGDWSQQENKALNTAIEEVRNEAGVAADAQNWSIPWFQVSEKMKTRTPAQCSNHYRNLHGLRKSGKHMPISALEKTPGRSRILTPSKMEQRLEGSASNSGKRAALSSKYVDDEDSDVEVGVEEAQQDKSNGIDTDNQPEEQNDLDKEKASPAKPNGVGSDHEALGEKVVETPHTNRGLLTKKTPGKTLGSSQLFAQTQANTSALKPPPSDSRRPISSQAQSQSQERPSPNVPIQLRTASRSPLQEIHPFLDADLIRGSNGDPQHSDSEDGDEEDADSDAAANENTELQPSENEGSEAEDEDDAASTNLANGVNGDNETGGLIEDEAEETSEDDSDSDSDEDSEGDVDANDDDTSSGNDSEGDDQESSVDDTTFDFMASINKSAQRSKSSQAKSSQSQRRGLKRKVTPSDDESEDEETESE